MYLPPHPAGVHAAYFAFENQTGAAAATLASDYYGFLTAFWALVVTALGLGIVWMAVVHFIPRLAPMIAHVAAAVCLVALGIIILVAGSA